MCTQNARMSTQTHVRTHAQPHPHHTTHVAHFTQCTHAMHTRTTKYVKRDRLNRVSEHTACHLPSSFLHRTQCTHMHTHARSAQRNDAGRRNRTHTHTRTMRTHAHPKCAHTHVHTYTCIPKKHLKVRTDPHMPLSSRTSRQREDEHQLRFTLSPHRTSGQHG